MNAILSNGLNRLLHVAWLCSVWGCINPSSWAQMPVIEFSAATERVDENAGTVAISVRRTGDTSLAFTVDYATSGTATAGADYVAQSGTLTFAPGEINRSISIPIVDDGLVEGDETVHLSLSNPGAGVSLGLQTNVVLTIHDNETPTVLDGTFDSGMGANNDIFAIALQPNGKILISGQFTSFNTTNRSRIARLNADGSLDLSFDPGLGADGDVYAVALQPDGKVLIGGAFTKVNGFSSAFVARLQTNGLPDPGFRATNTVNDQLRALAVQPDGKILIAGRFTTVAGQSRNRIARLNEDGSLDVSFNPGSGANNHIRALALQPDGNVIVAGQFTKFDGVSQNRIARLTSDGALDQTFEPGAGPDDEVRALALAPDGSIYLDGDFEFYNGLPRSPIARLFHNGSLDPAFKTIDAEDDVVRAIAVQPDGKVWIGGSFAMAGGATRSNIALLNTDGLADETTQAGPALDNEVRAIVLQPDGRLLLGGDFTTVNGAGHAHVARVYADQRVSSFEFSSANFTGTEKVGLAVITVQRSGESSNAVCVAYSTRDGTALAGTDYAAQAGTLTFGPLETLQQFTVPLFQDGLTETNETINLVVDKNWDAAYTVSVRYATSDGT